MYATQAVAAIEATLQTNTVTLNPGINLLAAEIHQNHGTSVSSDVLWGAEILAVFSPRPRLSVSMGGSPCGIAVSWAPSGGTLEESADLMSWSDSATQTNPQTRPCSGTRFFRVRR
jgi:hypothetical protein